VDLSEMSSKPDIPVVVPVVPGGSEPPVVGGSPDPFRGPEPPLLPTISKID
jgi:hypothetical protein